MSLLWTVPAGLLLVAVAITLLVLRRVVRDVAVLGDELSAVARHRSEVFAATARLRRSRPHGREGPLTGDLPR